MNVDHSISACIPCFNAEGTLQRAAESIRAQTMRVRELLVIDDGSSDRSPQIASAVADRCVRFESNRGRGAVRQRTIQELDSEFILFCDATLVLEAKFVESAVARMTSGKVAAVYGQVTDSSSRSFLDRWRQRHLFKTGTKDSADSKASLMTGGVLLRRSAVVDVGNFNRALIAGEDQELGERLLAAGYDVICAPELRLISLRRDGLLNLLRRYTRWNCAPGHVPSWREYGRLLGYHAGLVRRDLAARDLACALLTLAAPHFIFWSRRMRRKDTSPA